MRGHWPSGPWGQNLSLLLTSLCQGRSRVPHLQQAAKNVNRGVLFWGMLWEKVSGLPGCARQRAAQNRSALSPTTAF